jgi:glycosyltransferase involved in cell wall biosynthesis
VTELTGGAVTHDDTGDDSLADDCLSASPKAAPLVAVLLSTYDGARYLGEQLGSYTAQTHGNWRLYWRDDGSSDESAALVEAFAIGPGYGRCVPCECAGRLGAAGSFLTLLAMAAAGPADYFAFSDQDDVWLPDKLAHGVAALLPVPPSRPALYFCSRTLADASLAPLGQAPLPRRAPGFPAALTQNVVPGCCMIMNRVAAKLVGESRVPDGTWHDWWSYIVVAASDGEIIAGASSDILYRQHGGNLVGESLTVWRRGVTAWLHGRASFLALFWRHVAAVRAWNGPLTEQTRARLAIIERARHGGLFARIRALRVPGLVRQTRLETQVFRLWFLWG